MMQELMGEMFSARFKGREGAEQLVEIVVPWLLAPGRLEGDTAHLKALVDAAVQKHEQQQ